MGLVRAARNLGDVGAVLAVDETGFIKKSHGQMRAVNAGPRLGAGMWRPAGRVTIGTAGCLVTVGR
jgi:hypothetical protein